MYALRIILGLSALVAVACVGFGLWWSRVVVRDAPCTRTFSMPSAAMQPTLDIGDVVCADTTRFGSREPADGDIVIFSPPAALGKLPFMKRIVGSPGETVALHDGRLFRNGKQVDESYISMPATYTLEVKNFDLYVDGAPISNHAAAAIPSKRDWDRANQIPNGYYLVLGDNRNNSDDSHLWGFLRRDQLWGRATIIVWPLSHAHSLVQ